MTIPIQSGPYKTFRPLNADETFIEYEGSTITIPTRAQIKGELRTEEIKLRAYMRLEVSPAYVNELGTREFKFLIRDWDLVGYSPLLNELFYNHPLGLAGKDPAEPRRIVAMTVTLSRTWVKYGDDKDELFAPVRWYERGPDGEKELQFDVENLTSFELNNQSIYWSLRKHNQKWAVYFHTNADAASRGFDPRNVEHVQDIVGVAEGLEPEQPIRCSVSEASPVRRTWLKGNSVISKLVRAQKPAVVIWKLGSKPREGTGRIRLVSPPKCICTADQRPAVGMPFDSADFPARIVYAANYHSFLNSVRIMEDQSGIALAYGVHEIPPEDVKVAFEKPHANTVLGRFLEFRQGTCTGMVQISVDEYDQGLAQSRLGRSTPLAPPV